MKLSIIIVNYNVKYFLEQCLCSVQKALSGIRAEIIVIDNASSDGSLEYLQPKFPFCIFISNPENTGYATANNQGLRMATGQYVLFLNPDVILPEDCLHLCIEFLELHPGAGACGIRMVDGSGRFLPESKRGFPTLQASFYKLSGLSELFPRSPRFARYYLGHLKEMDNHEVDVLTGAFFMSRKEVLTKTGGFDELFFMYGEDIDLSYRIQKAGYKLFYLATTTIIHFKGESTKKGNMNYVKMFYNAMSIFVKKHDEGARFSPLNILTRVAIWSRASLSVIRNIYGRKKTRKTAGVINTMIIGDYKDVSEAISILNKSPYAARKIHHHEAEDQKLILPGSADEIIFCEGKLTYKRIIGLMQELPGNTSFGIHSTGSKSIVSSDSRNVSGNVMA